MATEASSQSFLAQSTQMPNFTFAPPNFGVKENQKNYVFVDEHNRHKRLKVMRACEGCRRRKIKCDAATTNTWPCSACIRLKLQCIPPTVNQDGEFSHEVSTYAPVMHHDTEYLGVGGDSGYQAPVFPLANDEQRRASHGDLGLETYIDNSHGYTSQPYFHQSDNHHRSTSIPYTTMQNHSPPMPEVPLDHELFPHPIQSNAETTTTPESWHSDQHTPDNSLSNALGDLKIDEAGVVPYITHQKKNLAEAPPVEEVDEYIRNLPSPSGPHQTIQIPPKIMPSDPHALRYFNIFFTEIHPYVPVLNKNFFYQQWHNNRESISVLLLEAIFACASTLSEGSREGAKWLALAGKHADSFMDVPRLSTLQAMLLILKARESSPQRGYYFRSWMTVVTLVTMAKDLGLHEHYALHQDDQPCDSTYYDCATKTRIWQTLFVCELMVGAPQGRSDFSVDPDTVDFVVPYSVIGLNDSDLRVSRNWTYMARIISNVRRMNDTYAILKKENVKDWGNDPRFVEIMPTFDTWYAELPDDLKITYPEDGSLLWIPSHYVGNLNSYYELCIIMSRRPQLAASASFAMDGDWRGQMMFCYAAAKRLCRLQEAILAQYGLSGLFCMQRGVNFTIYAILTCTVLHLVALTSPDPELSSDAQEYFTRHMRILERCTNSWPMPELQKQIEPLREAFSADTSQPFTLRETFQFNGARGGEVQALSAHRVQYEYHSGRNSSFGSSQSLSFNGQPISPPASTIDMSSRAQNERIHPIVMTQGGSRPTSQQEVDNSLPMMSTLGWNPGPIIDQWNTAFGTPTNVSVPTGLRVPSVAGTQTSTDIQDSFTSGVSTPERSPHTISFSAPPITPTFVSPSMWQSSVAAVYEGGLKRGWDFEGDRLVNPVPKRHR
ncbi:MAG: hypothetical protein M1833_002560 [Piccolia ochrophora]|nr:MAG: hypothetical protein M1833_002560 [Piccolia ochrophora]